MIIYSHTDCFFFLMIFNDQLIGPDLTGPTHPDGEQRGGVEGCEQHGVTKHQDEAGSKGDLQGGTRREHVNIGAILSAGGPGVKSS